MISRMTASFADKPFAPAFWQGIDHPQVASSHQHGNSETSHGVDLNRAVGPEVPNDFSMRVRGLLRAWVRREDAHRRRQRRGYPGMPIAPGAMMHDLDDTRPIDAIVAVEPEKRV